MLFLLWLRGPGPKFSGRTILNLAGFASIFRNFDEVDVTDSSPWWDREVYADRRPFLLARGRIMAALRDWFRRRGFLEVETPALQVSPGNEVHLHAFATELVSPGGEPSRRYLHTSPEFACKKLLAAGEPQIFTFARVFRNRERGPLHHPEFTMLEWYRTNEPYDALMADCAALMAEAAKAAGCARLQWRDRTADPFAAPERLAVAAAFEKFAGIDLLATLNPDEPDRDRLAAAARASASKSPMTTPGPTYSAACWSSGSSRSSGSAPRHCSTSTRCPKRRGRDRPPIRGWRSVSSSTPAESSSPTASAS